MSIFRKLSVSNFEPIKPQGMVINAKTPTPKEVISTFGTPQTSNSDNAAKNEAFLSCVNKLVLNTQNSLNDDYHFNPDQLFKKPEETAEQALRKRSKDHEMEAQTHKQNENRLSFDFCELDADQMLESTPHSYRNEYRCSSKVLKQFVFN